MNRIRLIALASASIVLLTGCGAVPAFNPGVAARVGDETVSLAKVDDVSTSFCEYVEGQLQEGQVLAQHYLRGQVVGALALRAAVDQFADEQGVSAAEDYDTAVTEARKQLGSLPDDQVQAVIDVQGVQLYMQAVEKSVGEQQGATGDDATAAGQKLFRRWLADHDVDVDPRFGVSIDKGTTAPVDTSLSYSLGDTSKLADADNPDPTYGAELPDSQRCG
ncbi:hypothetical protein [Nocardioides sp.]|uniref:hypothetical protein n=1 Tax=Nocardioides sp. TaxID=35761 RepID=UPI002ED930F4